MRFIVLSVLVVIGGCRLDDKFKRTEPGPDQGIVVTGDMSLAEGDMAHSQSDDMAANGEGSDMSGSASDLSMPTPTKTLAFGQILPYPTANPADGVVVGDFKEDGFPDFAVTTSKFSVSNGVYNVIVYTNKGNGSFTASSPYSLSATPYSPAAAVFTTTKHLDLAVPCDDGLHLLFGAGDGTFVAGAMTYPAGSLPQAVAVADFDSNQTMDIVVADFDDTSESVLLGNGNGTFATAIPVGVGNKDVTSIAVGDFNTDGKPDFVVPYTTGPTGSGTTVPVLINAGNHMFFAPTPYAAGTAPTSVAVGDVNSDNKPDIIVSNMNGAGVLTNKGNGQFNDAKTYTAGNTPLNVALADFNTDGKLDIAVANNGGGTGSSVSVLLNAGDGTFPNHKEFPVGTLLRAISVADFNTDGLPDIVAIGNDGANVLINTSTR